MRNQNCYRNHHPPNCRSRPFPPTKTPNHRKCHQKLHHRGPAWPAAPRSCGEITFIEFSATAPLPTGGGGRVSTGTLTVETEVGGVVTSNPAVIQCTSGNTCEAQVPLGTVVALIATPSPGNHFDDWDGCFGQSTETRSGGICIRTILESNIIRAEFDLGSP